MPITPSTTGLIDSTGATITGVGGHDEHEDHYLLIDNLTGGSSSAAYGYLGEVEVDFGDGNPQLVGGFAAYFGTNALGETTYRPSNFSLETQAQGSATWIPYGSYSGSVLPIGWYVFEGTPILVRKFKFIFNDSLTVLNEVEAFSPVIVRPTEGQKWPRRIAGDRPTEGQKWPRI
jgi:hypothetical protein